jgi:hypothetical protein
MWKTKCALDGLKPDNNITKQIIQVFFIDQLTQVYRRKVQKSRQIKVMLSPPANSVTLRHGEKNYANSSTFERLPSLYCGT